MARHSRSRSNESDDRSTTSSAASSRSSRSGRSRRHRREFWGKAKSRVNGGNNDQAGSDATTSRDDLIVMNLVGPSAMYTIFGQDLEQAIPNEQVLRVVKLLFSSLAVVFRDTKIENGNSFRYVRKPSIPVCAARLLWSQLLGGVSISYDGERPIVSVGSNNGERERDPSISQDALNTFLDYVNGTNAASRKHNERRGWTNFLNPRAQRNIQNNADSLKKQRKGSKDPFFDFVTNALVETGFLELVGKQNDEEDDDEEISETQSTEDTDDQSITEHFGQDLGQGWKGDAAPSSRRSRYFQIYKDMQFQFGIYMSGVPSQEGGFCMLQENPGNDDQQQLAYRELDSMKRWNNTMSGACRAQLVAAEVLSDPNHVPDREPSWSLPKPTPVNPFDDATSYALRMYPMHLMRSGHVAEAARTIMNGKFYLARLICFGSFDASNQQRANIEEMMLRHKLGMEGLEDVRGDGDAIDSKEVMFATIHVMVKTLGDRFSVTDGPSSHGQQEREPGEVGRALHMIATFLAEKGESKPSMDIFRKALDYKINALGKDHASVGRTYRHIGHQHLHQYEYDKAIEAYQESVRIELLQDEVDNRRVILALNSLGMIFGMTGKPEKAIESYGRSLSIQKANFGDTNLQVAETLNSMGIVHGMMGHFDSSVECYSEALYVKIRKLGKDHVEVADVYFNLGLVHNKQNDHEAAINAYQEALRIRKDRLGEEHEEVARVLHHIGVVLSDMGEVGDAMRFYEESLRIRRLVLGDEHEDVARTLHNLGLVYYDSGSYDRALECFEDALRLGKKKVGRKSEKVADTLHSMGLVYQKLANFKESIQSYEKAVSIRRQKLGEDHLEVASTLHNMGDVFYMMGDLDKAMEIYEKAYKIRKSKLGGMDVDVAATQNNMGVVFMKKGDHRNAMECFDAALKIRENELGPDHEKCSDTLHNMGLVHKNLKEYSQAIARYEQALRVRKMQLGENDMKVADTLYNMAIVYANTGQYAKALERYKEALRTYRETGMTDDHPSVVNTLQWIKWAQKKLSKMSRKDGGNQQSSSSSVSTASSTSST